MTDSQPVETIEYDIPDDLSDLGEATPPEKYRTLLEIWRAVLEPATSGEMVAEPIAPQWAVKMVTTYPGVGFADVDAIHTGVFEFAAELAQILEDEIASDDECLKKASATEDAEENARHYKDLLAKWQIHIMEEELAWRPAHRDAATTLAILSEVQQMFLGETGLVAHLEQIGFQFDDDDKQELQDHLVAARAMVLGQGGDDE